MSKYYKITEKELLSLVSCKDTCIALGWDLAEEGYEADKAVKAICKRNGIEISNNYSEQCKSIKI